MQSKKSHNFRCPFCEKIVKSEPLKEWTYSGRKVKQYLCENCNKKFKLYTGDEYQYTVPKPKNPS